MAPRTQLGLMGQLPREIRDQIYEYIMPWNNYPSKYYAREVADLALVLRRPTKPDRLALLRVNRTISGEVTAMLYAKSSLTFVLSPGWSHRGRYNEPNVKVRLSHRFYGSMFLSILKGPMESAASSKMYKAINFRRFGGVQIEVRSPRDYDAGELLVLWWGVKTITDVLEKSPPRVIEIVPKGSWMSDGEPLLSVKSPSKKHVRSDLRIILTPFGRIGVEKTRPCVIKLRAPTHMCPWIISDSQPSWTTLNDDESECILQRPSPNELGRAVFFSGTTGNIIEQRFVDSWLDYYLEETPGLLAVTLRQQRWEHWSLAYECEMIRAAKTMETARRISFLQALAKRWAIRRAMNPEHLRQDYCAWMNIPPPYKRHSSSRNESARHCDLCPPDWMRNYQYAQKGNREWEALKERGLFYKRRILITSQGIVWDPHHVSDATRHDRKFNARGEVKGEVLLCLEPPAKPSTTP